MGHSDKDYMYEIGPLLVNSKPFTGAPIYSSDESLYLYSTENTGVYTIWDKNDGFIYPRVMQSNLLQLFVTFRELLY